MSPRKLLGWVVDDIPIANLPLRLHRAAPPESGYAFAEGAWIEPADWAAFLASPAGRLRDAAGHTLATKPGSPEGELTVHASFLIRHTWDLLRANEQAIAALAPRAPEGAIAPGAVIDGMVHLGPRSRILPGVYIEGRVVIGADCKIGPNCYIRGATAIGDGCHIGQAVELKNCLIMSKTNVGHLSYVGDSVLGHGVNFGAGTITANLRHDGREHRAMAGDALMPTGRRKLGVFVGDGVHTGIHTSLYPGRTLHAGSHTLPGEVVKCDKHPESPVHP